MGGWLLEPAAMESVVAVVVSENLLPARMQMAFTLGFHIILACFGVGLPILMLAAEWQYLRTDDRRWLELAKRWSKAFAVLFAIGAVSGTVLSFELGLLWPKFMGTFGAVIGLPFTMEGFAFFLEAIFAGIYLYGWERLPKRLHWWTGVPIALAGFLSAAFVVTANAWMNCPRGFRMENGMPVEIDPLAAMWNPASGAQIVHMILAAYVVTGCCVAAFYARLIVNDRQSDYARRGMALGLWMAIVFTPLQMLSGDWAAKVVAKSQPIKLAAMEGQYETVVGAPLRIGGLPNDETEQTKYSIEIPKLLSFLAYADFQAEVKGLKEFPKEERPPTAIVHIAFQFMVGIGSYLMLLVGWAAFTRIRTQQFSTSSLFLWLTVAAGPLSVVALEAGWTVTEVGRQPWIAHGVMRTAEAVTESPGVWSVFYATLVIYAVLGFALVTVLRLLAARPLSEGVNDGT